MDSIVSKATVAGKAIALPSVFEVENPATERIIGTAPDCGAGLMDDAMQVAHGSFPAWAGRPDRSELLLECAKRLKRETVKLARLLTLEQGKPIKEAINEIMGAGLTLRYFAELQLQQQKIDANSKFQVHRQPLGVIAAITPWNYPIILAIGKIAPALAAGNTVMLKPSPYTPLSTLAVGELFNQVLPPGVLNVVSGGDELGAAMATHPLVRKITVTGSVETGKAVARAAADDLKRVVMELGGNDAAIVLADADPGRIAKDLFWGAFRNCGQLCLAIKRLYVHEAVHSQVVSELKQIAENVIVGDGSENSTELGPLNNRPQFERVQALVADARKAGSNIVAGGEKLPRDGYFFQPTIVDEVAEGTALVDEEQFGPVLPLIRFDDVEDAIARANATQFGLGGSIWSSDAGRAADLAQRLDCGAVWINQHGITDPSAPIGGRKWSGMGYENGNAGLDEYYQHKTVWA